MSEHLKCENIVKVGEQELQYSEAVGIVVCGILSMLLCLTIVVIHFVLKAPWSRRHPGEMVALRCVAEFAFSLIFVILPLSSLRLSDARSDFYHSEPIQNDDKHIYSDDGTSRFLLYRRSQLCWNFLYSLLSGQSFTGALVFIIVIGTTVWRTHLFLQKARELLVLICFGIPFNKIGTLSPNLRRCRYLCRGFHQSVLKKWLCVTNWTGQGELKDAKSRGKEGPEGMIREESIQPGSIVQFHSNDDAVNEYGILAMGQIG